MTRGDGRVQIGGKQHENLKDYLSGFLAAVRTHQRLTDGKTLRVEAEARGRIPLAQRILLR